MDTAPGTGDEATIKVASKKDGKEKSKTGTLRLKRAQPKTPKLGIWNHAAHADGTANLSACVK
jgi:hypothetical protein